MAIKKFGAYEVGTFKYYLMLDNVTADTTGANEALIAGAKKVTLVFTRADHSSGSSAFKVQVTLDGTTWIDFAMLIDNLTNTNAQTLTRITTKTLAANGSAICTMDLERMNFLAMRVVVTETTDGTHKAEALVEF